MAARARARAALHRARERRDARPALRGHRSPPRRRRDDRRPRAHDDRDASSRAGVPLEDGLVEREEDAVQGELERRAVRRARRCCPLAARRRSRATPIRRRPRCCTTSAGRAACAGSRWWWSGTRRASRTTSSAPPSRSTTAVLEQFFPSEAGDRRREEADPETSVREAAQDGPARAQSADAGRTEPKPSATSRRPQRADRDERAAPKRSVRVHAVRGARRRARHGAAARRGDQLLLQPHAPGGARDREHARGAARRGAGRSDRRATSSTRCS